MPLVKIRQIFNPAVSGALQRLGQFDLDMDLSREFKVFAKAYDTEVVMVQEIGKKNEEKLKSGDPEATKQWNDLMDKEVELPYLPHDILRNHEKIKGADDLALEPFIDPEESAPASPAAPVIPAKLKPVKR